MLPLILQAIALMVVTELLVRSMPAAWRRASRENCYRLDGTRSPNRAYREWRAFNRLRRDLVLALLIVFLTGNAVYQTIDKTMAPIDELAWQAWQSVTGVVEIAEESRGTAESGTASAWQRHWLSVVGLGGVWFGISALVLGWACYSGFAKFAEGVKARSTEHYHLDITRSTVDQPQGSTDQSTSSSAGTGVA